MMLFKVLFFNWCILECMGQNGVTLFVSINDFLLGYQMSDKNSVSDSVLTLASKSCLVSCSTFWSVNEYTGTWYLWGLLRMRSSLTSSPRWWKLHCRWWGIPWFVNIDDGKQSTLENSGREKNQTKGSSAIVLLFNKY